MRSNELSPARNSFIRFKVSSSSGFVPNGFTPSQRPEGGSRGCFPNPIARLSYCLGRPLAMAIGRRTSSNLRIQFPIATSPILVFRCILIHLSNRDSISSRRKLNHDLLFFVQETEAGDES